MLGWNIWRISSSGASLLWPDNSICTRFDLVVSFIPGFCEVVFLSFSVISRGSPASLVVVSLCVFCLVSSPPMKVSWVIEGSHGVKLLLRSFVSPILLPMVNGLLGCIVVFSFGLARLSLQSVVSLFLPPMVNPGCWSASSAWWMGSCPRSICWESLPHPLLFPCCGRTGWILVLTCWRVMVIPSWW